MATKTLTFNFADANEADIVAALKAAATGTLPKNPDGTDPVPTKPQAWAWFEDCCKASLRDVVRRHKQEERAKAQAAIVDVDVT